MLAKRVSRHSKLSLFAGLTLALLTASSCSKSSFGLPDQAQQFAAGVTYNNKVDIILMMDNSSSMLQYQNKFANEVPAMIKAMDVAGLDYHIAVVTTDMRSVGTGGKFQGSPKFVSNSTPDLVTNLQARVRQGQAGSDLERGLDSLRASLQPSYLAADGAGFLRDDALLSMVILSNEDDYGTDSVATYGNFFDQVKPPLKGTTKGWLMNYMGVLSLGGQCSTTAEFKEVGTRYLSLTDETGGVKQSICDSSLTAAISNLRVRIIEILSAYRLDRVPLVSSLVVTVNGVVVAQDATNGWTYNADNNSVLFHGTALPGAHDVLHVDFTPASGT